MRKWGQRRSYPNLRDLRNLALSSCEKGCSGDLLSPVFLASLNLTLSSQVLVKKSRDFYLSPSSPLAW